VVAKIEESGRFFPPWAEKMISHDTHPMNLDPVD